LNSNIVSQAPLPFAFLPLPFDLNSMRHFKILCQKKHQFERLDTTLKEPKKVKVQSAKAMS